MRDIKFRAWCEIDDTMIKPMSIQEMIHQRKNTFSLKSLKEDIIFMQYTELKDINGIEIYEGDIVRWGMDGQECWHRYAKVMINPDIQFQIIYYVDSETLEKKPTDRHTFRFGNFIYKNTQEYLEIIGNIYENKELLNV